MSMVVSRVVSMVAGWWLVPCERGKEGGRRGRGRGRGGREGGRVERSVNEHQVPAPRCKLPIRFNYSSSPTQMDITALFHSSLPLSPTHPPSISPRDTFPPDPNARFTASALGCVARLKVLKSLLLAAHSSTSRLAGHSASTNYATPATATAANASPAATFDLGDGLLFAVPAAAPLSARQRAELDLVATTAIKASLAHIDQLRKLSQHLATLPPPPPPSHSISISAATQKPTSMTPYSLASLVSTLSSLASPKQSPSSQYSASSTAQFLTLHREGIIWYCERLLMDISKTQRSMQESRLAQLTAFARDSRPVWNAPTPILSASTSTSASTSGSGSASRVRAAMNPALDSQNNSNDCNEGDQTQDLMLSPYQRQLLEKENKAIVSKLQNDLDQVRYLPFPSPLPFPSKSPPKKLQINKPPLF